MCSFQSVNCIIFRSTFPTKVGRIRIWLLEFGDHQFIWRDSSDVHRLSLVFLGCFHPKHNSMKQGQCATMFCWYMSTIRSVLEVNLLRNLESTSLPSYVFWISLLLILGSDSAHGAPSEWIRISLARHPPLQTICIQRSTLTCNRNSVKRKSYFFDVTKEVMWWSNTSSSNSCSTSTQINTIICVDIQIHAQKNQRTAYVSDLWGVYQPLPPPMISLYPRFYLSKVSRTKHAISSSPCAIPSHHESFLDVKLGPTIISHQQLTWKTFRNPREWPTTEIARNINILEPSVHNATWYPISKSGNSYCFRFSYKIQIGRCFNGWFLWWFLSKAGPFISIHVLKLFMGFKQIMNRFGRKS